MGGFIFGFGCCIFDVVDVGDIVVPAALPKETEFVITVASAFGFLF